MFLLFRLPVPLPVIMVIPSVECLFSGSGKSFSFIVLTPRPRCRVLPFGTFLSFSSSTFLAAVSGNMIYIAYRGEVGPREFFKGNFPEIHEIFFEFKEFIGLFPLPIAVAATFILWKYRNSLPVDENIRNAVGVMIAVAWTVLMIVFILGARITKLMGV